MSFCSLLCYDFLDSLGVAFPVDTMPFHQSLISMVSLKRVILCDTAVFLGGLRSCNFVLFALVFRLAD